MLNENIVRMLAREIISGGENHSRALLALKVYCGEESYVTPIITEFAREKMQEKAQIGPFDLINILNEWEDLHYSLK